MTFVAVAALSHDGLVRDHNEDSVVVGPWTTCAAVTPTPATLVFSTDTPVVVAVADGLGGHPAGDVASTLVVQQLARLGPYLGDEQAVRVAVDACNRAVYEEAERDPAHGGMGTTVAGLVAAEDTLIVFNVGDSRVYAVDDAMLTRLSVDDSPPLAPGQTHTVIVTQTIGGTAAERSIEPHLTSREPAVGDRYLICTDGLSDVVDEPKLGAALSGRGGGEAAYELWRAAMEAGGPDNITVAVVDLIEDLERR
jgi:PPM family protein phosphatase